MAGTIPWSVVVQKTCDHDDDDDNDDDDDDGPRPSFSGIRRCA